MSPTFFAYNQYRDYVIYKALAEVEPVPEFKHILEKLIEQEYDDYAFWRQFSEKKEFTVRSLDVAFFKFVRKVFGLTFTAKLLEGHEKEMQAHYSAYLSTVTDPSLKTKMEEIIKREIEHEQHLVSQVKEENVQFMSSIVLGINDGLIELSGALVGFAFALRMPDLVALTGFITGIAASLSMAASAYMQAQYEEGKEARKAALYTGVSYFIVVLLLVAPFVFFSNLFVGLALMLSAVVFVVVAISFYTAVLFERHFTSQLVQMLTFSLGVATIVFVIATLLRVATGGGIL